MKTLSIPVRVIGPGSQPEEEPLQYLDMPRAMDTFQMPSVPQRAAPEALAESHDVLTKFLDVLWPWDPAAGGPGPSLDVTGVSPAALKITNQMLGEGEVSIQINGAHAIRIQESVFTGVWRVCELDGEGRLVGDWIEAGSMPDAVIRGALAAADPTPALVTLPAGAMNSPALLEEIQAHLRNVRPGTRAHVINLTLFPLTAEDQEVLAQALPVGPVAMMSRGFGHCRISSTLVRNVWRVQYYNSMNTLILNTIEIVDVPDVALAAPDDLADSKERLAELVAWMREPAAA